MWGKKCVRCPPLPFAGSVLWNVKKKVCHHLTYVSWTSEVLSNHHTGQNDQPFIPTCYSCCSPDLAFYFTLHDRIHLACLCTPLPLSSDIIWRPIHPPLRATEWGSTFLMEMKGLRSPYNTDMIVLSQKSQQKAVCCCCDSSMIMVM